MNDDDRRFAETKQIVGTCFNPDTNGKPRREMHPIERPLNIRKALGQTANNVGIRSHSEPDAVPPNSAAIDEARSAPERHRQLVMAAGHFGSEYEDCEGAGMQLRLLRPLCGNPSSSHHPVLSYPLVKLRCGRSLMRNRPTQLGDTSRNGNLCTFEESRCNVLNYFAR